jgi:hypothetical protein
MKIRLQLTSATPVTIVAWWSTIPVGMTPPPALPSSACTVLTGAAQACNCQQLSNFGTGRAVSGLSSLLINVSDTSTNALQCQWDIYAPGVEVQFLSSNDNVRFSIMECSNFLSTQQCLSMYAKASGRRRFGSPWLQHPMDENVGVAKQFLPGFMRISFKKMSNSQPLSVLGVCLTWSEDLCVTT